jgi:OOP family OmpA-OmpF porin
MRGWPCAQAKTACGEVELVHAGHEQAQLGWRHAKPYVQIAEDLIG